MLIIFDKDGTLVDAREGEIPNSVADQLMKPLVVDKCWELREEGHELAIATNQGGVAHGYLTIAEARRMVEDVAEKIGATGWRICPYHPEGTVAEYREEHFCRKPNPGMLLELMAELGYQAHETLFVGDRPEDMAAGISAGVGFRWAWDFFLEV